jgi:Smg protein
MNGTVLDILIYVFDRYMLDEAPEVPEREALARDLESAGFGEANVERALDWLADLAGERHRTVVASAPTEPAEPATLAPQEDPLAIRVYSALELMHLPPDCRGLLLALEQVGILDPQQREIVIERLLALEAEEFDLEKVKWVVLMVLSSQPGQEQACARMEDLVFETPESALH